MSENYRFYVVKMAERRARLVGSGRLRWQLEEIFCVVQRCEAMWMLEDRIEKQR
jgi:hypothetical protein